MSDAEPTAEDRGGSDVASATSKGTSPLRLIILLIIFGTALAGLLYDYTIARPAIQKADNTIQGLLSGSIEDPDGDGTVTANEVQALIGSAPSRVKQLTNGRIEVYSWRSGLPYRTYDLHVVYVGQKMPLLYSASTNAEPTSDQLPPETVMGTERHPLPSMPGAGGSGPPPKPPGGKKAKTPEDDQPAMETDQPADESDVAPPSDEAAPSAGLPRQDTPADDTGHTEPASDPPADEPADKGGDEGNG
jgi:hypothetical protein